MDRITRLWRRRRVRSDRRERRGCQRCEEECIHGNLETEFDHFLDRDRDHADRRAGADPVAA